MRMLEDGRTSCIAFTDDAVLDLLASSDIFSHWLLGAIRASDFRSLKFVGPFFCCREVSP